MQESTTDLELRAVVEDVSALGVSPADPKDWRDLRLGFHLRVCESFPDDNQENVVSTRFARLFQGITQNRQAAFRTAKERGEAWSQADEEDEWYRKCPEAVASLNKALGTEIYVRTEEQMRRESRTHPLKAFANLQGLPRGTMGSAQRKGAWFTEEMITDIVKSDKSETTPDMSQGVNYTVIAMDPPYERDPSFENTSMWVVTFGYDV